MLWNEEPNVVVNPPKFVEIGMVYLIDTSPMGKRVTEYLYGKNTLTALGLLCNS
jgi:hypothetical protein